MAPPDRGVEADARLLVKHIVELSSQSSKRDNEENLSRNHLAYERCVDSALHTFARHRFLDVDRHSVWRSIDGLCRKLLVHSQEERSAKLKSLCERFVQSDVFRGGDRECEGLGDIGCHSSIVDIEYSLLSLLVHLADRPTGIIGHFMASHRVGDPDRQHSNLDDEMDVDQKNELLRKSVLSEIAAERESQEKSPPSSSDDLSDWSDTDDFHQSFNSHTEAGLADDKNAHPLSILPPDPYNYPLGRSQERSENRVGLNDCESRAWLSHNLTFPYWMDSLGSSQPPRSYISRATNLRCQWEDCIDSQCVMRTIDEAVELTERQILRETLWLLQGRQQLFVYEHSNGSWIVRNGVAVSHLTQLALRHMLDSFASLGNTLATLRCFVERTTNSRALSTQSIPMCRTYEAYASALSTSLNPLNLLLCQLERTCSEQSLSLTILTLFDRLRPWFARLKATERIHEVAVVSCSTEASACEMAIRIQTELYSDLVHAASEGGGSVISRHTVSFLLNLFMETIRPYLHMIDSWVTFGIIRDDYSEFFLARNEQVTTSDGTFWENAVVVRHHGPPFLCSTLEDLIITGKSTHLLRRLDRLGRHTSKEREPEAEFIAPGQLLPLHEAFAECFQQELRLLSPKCIEVAPEQLNLIQSQRSSANVSGPLWERILASNFEEPSADSFLEDRKVDTDVDPSSFPSWSRHLDDVICECLNTLIRSRCRINSSKLVDILDKEFGLGDHLLSIRKFYLMEAGNIMFHFYSQLFEKIPANDIWNEEEHIEMILEDVLACYAVPEANRCNPIGDALISINFTVPNKLSVKLDRNAAGASSADFFHMYDAIRLSYKVPWPLDLVISPLMWRKYDRIFSFLLRVKCTKYALDELRFVDLKERTDLKTVYSLHRIRVKLLHFVNGFHGFLMTRLLYEDISSHESSTTKKSFKLGNQSLQDVMDEQRELLERLEERCLLQTRTSAVLEAIANVFNLALAFHAFWKGTNVDGGEKIMTKVDRELRHCGPFLIAVLRKSSASSPQLLPHLESLVSTLCDGSNTYDGDNDDVIIGKHRI